MDEMLGGYHRFQVEEALQFRHLVRRIADQTFSVDEMDPFPGEMIQPAFQVPTVHPDLDGTPGRVDHPAGVVDKRELLEAAQVGPLADGLRVVGDGSGDRITDDHDQPDVLWHAPDPLRDASGDEVTRSLFDRDLILARWRHLVSKRKNKTYL